MNIAKMMRDMQNLQKKTEQLQDKLAEQTFEASVQNGLITATANGAGDLVGIKIQPAIVNPDDVEMLEDLVLLAVKQAVSKAKEEAAREMGKLTSGLGLPPGMGL
jgi:nucleoid-associated protein EbfC